MTGPAGPHLAQGGVQRLQALLEMRGETLEHPGRNRLLVEEGARGKVIPSRTQVGPRVAESLEQADGPQIPTVKINPMRMPGVRLEPPIPKIHGKIQAMIPGNQATMLGVARVAAITTIGAPQISNPHHRAGGHRLPINGKDNEEITTAIRAAGLTAVVITEEAATGMEEAIIGRTITGIAYVSSSSR